jgi:hypothetical protein
MPQAPDTPHYRYDQKLGDPNAAYTPASLARPELNRPEVPARFVVTVDGATLINSMWGKRRYPWRAEPGTRCVILGYWGDDTVQLRWPAIAGAYRVEGRFPAWVVAEDLNAKMAAGGHMLLANDPDVQGPPLISRLGAFIGNLLHINH